jgi:hypothetical protein
VTPCPILTPRQDNSHEWCSRPPVPLCRIHVLARSILRLQEFLPLDSVKSISPLLGLIDIATAMMPIAIQTIPRQGHAFSIYIIISLAANASQSYGPPTGCRRHVLFPYQLQNWFRGCRPLQNLKQRTWTSAKIACRASKITFSLMRRTPHELNGSQCSKKNRSLPQQVSNFADAQMRFLLNIHELKSRFLPGLGRASFVQLCSSKTPNPLLTLWN